MAGLGALDSAVVTGSMETVCEPLSLRSHPPLGWHSECDSGSGGGLGRRGKCARVVAHLVTTFMRRCRRGLGVQMLFWVHFPVLHAGRKLPQAA